MKIFLIGSIGRRNIGDDAICISLVKTLIKFHKSSKIFFYIYTRGDYIKRNFTKKHTLQIHFVSSFFKVLKAFLDSEFIVIGGGDYIGCHRHPVKKIKGFIIFFTLAILSKIVFKKFVMINNSFCARTRSESAFLKIITRLAYYVSVRDSNSFNLISRYIHGKLVKGFDTAILLDNFYQPTIKIYNGDVKKIGFSITPVFSNFFLKPKKDKELSKAIARELNLILKKDNNINLYFLSFNIDRKDGDLNLIRDITENLDTILLKRIHIIAYDDTLYSFLSKFSQLDYIICCKYHSIIFSYLFNKPIVVIGYHPKNAGLIHDIKLSKRAFISLEDVLNGKIKNVIFKLLNDPQRFKATLPIHEAKKRALSGVLSGFR